MNAPPMIDMMEATRLTREGRLAEAMVVLRGALAGAPAGTGPDLERDAGRAPPARTPTVLDMAPPTPASDGAWTMPQFHEARPERPGGVNRPHIPEALRRFLDRIGQPDAARRIDGLNGRAGLRAPIPLPDGAQFEEHIYANAAGSRSYKLYIPSGYTGQALPLLVMLHGCTQSPDDFAAGTRMNDLAEEKTFLVAYPAQTQSANASKCWNWFSAGNQQRDQGEPSLIAGITRRIMQDYPVERGCVYIAGLSAGGAAAAIMGATYPDLYAAVGVHSGLACGVASDVSSAFAAMRQGGSQVMGRSRLQGARGAVPTIVFHGDRDTTVNPINGDQVIAQSKAAADLRISVSRGEAAGGIRYTRTVQADESGRPILEQWVLHEAGHAWSGGSAAGTYTEPRGPDASREMMRFFLQQNLELAAE
jgi:poly(hydroxyalkanoate) depolymerase family esterase